MPVTSAQVAVTATPVLLVGETGSERQVYVYNRGAASVFLGPSTVSSSNGFELSSGTEVSNPIDVPPGETLYAVAASGSQRVDVLSVGS